MRRLTILFSLVLTSVRAVDPAELCSDVGAGPERSRCFENAFAEHPAGAAELAALRRLVEDDPALAERLALGAEGTLDGAGPVTASFRSSRERDRLRSELFDLRGQALGKIGRTDEAADALRSAVALDDGTNRLVWLDDEGRAAWSARLDAGIGRQERAARAMLAAGRPDAARAMLAHVLASGGEGAAQEAWAQVGGGVVPGLDPAPLDLYSLPWYPPLPELDVKLVDGSSFPLASARGNVLLVDFWASWCAPCVHELPRVQALADELRAAGLVVLTVNARETGEAARAAATSLRLTLPIGFYDDTLDRALRVRSLPTILLVDRLGRIRHRWDAFVPDFDAEVAVKARALLAEKPEANRRKVALVRAGAGLLEVRWTRETAAPIVGIAVLPDELGAGRLVAASGDQLLLLGASGAIDRRQPLPSGTSGRLRGVAPRGPARYDVVSFRPGRPEIAWIDSRGGAVHSQTVASPVLDAASLRGTTPDPSDGKLALATLGGAFVTGPDGPETQWSDVAGEVRAIATQAGAAPRAWALDAEGKLRLLDATGHVMRETDVDRTARRILAAPEGFPGLGVLPRSVRAAVVGRFLPGGRAQAAAATEDGQLVVVDLATGAIPFRARFTRIDELAAGDLDGDGKDELVVAADRTLTVLGAALAGPPPPPVRSRS